VLIGKVIQLVITIQWQLKRCGHAQQHIQLAPPLSDRHPLLFERLDLSNSLSAITISLQSFLIHHRNTPGAFLGMFSLGATAVSLRAIFASVKRISGRGVFPADGIDALADRML